MAQMEGANWVVGIYDCFHCLRGLPMWHEPLRGGFMAAPGVP